MEAVLAARDPAALKRQLDLEHVRVTTETMQEQAANRGSGAGGGKMAGEEGAEDGAEVQVSYLLLQGQDPAARLQEVESEIERVRALHAAMRVEKAGAPPAEEDEAEWRREAAALVASAMGAGEEGAYQDE